MWELALVIILLVMRGLEVEATFLFIARGLVDVATFLAGGRGYAEPGFNIPSCGECGGANADVLFVPRVDEGFDLDGDEPESERNGGTTTDL